MTQAYKDFIDRCKVKIIWVKVQSHTGIALNDRADELAKSGARQTNITDKSEEKIIMIRTGLSNLSR